MNFPMTDIVSPTKKIFSKEAQAYMHELKNKILELDVSLPNFHKQLDSLLATNKLFQDAAIKAGFYIPNSPFAQINHNLETSINLFRDRQTDIDWITKELLIEVINMSNRVINEYCLGINSSTDWMSLQEDLFTQINEHLRSQTDELTALIGSAVYDKTNEPFNLDDTPEALHLFDIDFDMDSEISTHEKLYEPPIAQLDNSDSFLMIQIDQEDNYSDSHELFQDVSESSTDELTTLFPSLESDMFTGNLDELTEDLQDSHEIGNEEKLPMPELLADIFVSSTSAEKLVGNDDETELQGVRWNDHEEALESVEDISEIEDNLDNIWTKFTAIDSWDSTNDEDLVPSFDLSDFELSNDEIFEHVSPNNSLELLEHNISSVDSDENLPLKPSTIPSNQLQIDSSTMLAEMLKDDFPTSDIDTALEESPIYQNNKDIDSSWHDLSLINLGDQEISYTDFSALSRRSTHGLDLDRGHINHKQSGIQIAKRGSDATIRLPLHHLEMLGDLSEELLVRKGSLDIYLSEIKTLSGDAQKHLQFLEPNLDSQTQTAIAELNKSVEQIVNVLALTEQQTDAMSQDICHLRTNLRQVLKHPISSLVRKFPRILRDLSLQYGKQVELIVQGAEVEVERLISDVIAEPLEILLRNAFEHGIESPQDRKQQGKISQGKIEFIATHTDESTIIQVNDDGCGIDIEKIRNQVEQSAAIAGMSGFSTMDMSDEQLIGLIFEPSFNLTHPNSHSEMGTKLSDVKKKLREFGGTISVKSQKGKGTQFTLVLPNILSLIRVLLVDINQMCLAIPSKVVLEVIPSKSHGYVSDEQETLLWRNLLLPIVRLNSSLKLNCRHSLSQASRQSSQSPQSTNQPDQQKPAHVVPSFLVIQHEHNLFALQTDGCWHDQEATFHQIEGDIILPQIFLGTVILGSNQTIALLNPAELVSQFLHPNDSVLVTQSSPTNLNNLSNLSDFFGGSDVLPEPTLSQSLVKIERDSAHSQNQSTEPDNRQSSGWLTKDLANAPVRRSQQPRVLIVESSANVRRYLAMTLTKSGFLTEQVQDGKEAIAFLKECLEISLNVDVVITDLEMPHMDGFKLLSNIRAEVDLQNLPIIVLTAKNNENDQKLALELGANAYFNKPYREQELIKKLHQIIAG